jgi:hypothetical protein
VRRLRIRAHDGIQLLDREGVEVVLRMGVSAATPHTMNRETIQDAICGDNAILAFGRRRQIGYDLRIETTLILSDGVLHAVQGQPQEG